MPHETQIRNRTTEILLISQKYSGDYKWLRLQIISTFITCAAKKVPLRGDYLSAIVNALPTRRTSNARTWATRRVKIFQLHRHRFNLEQFFITGFRVCAKLTLSLVSNLRMLFVSESARTLKRHNANRLV